MTFAQHAPLYKELHWQLTVSLAYNEDDLAAFLASRAGINTIARGLERHQRDHPSERIEDLALPRGVLRCLMRSGRHIRTVTELENLHDGDLLGIQGIGAISLSHIRSAIKAFRS